MDTLEEARTQQEDHQERREQALTERQNLQTKRKELRQKRLNTRDVQANLMSEFRKICLNAKTLDHETIFELYDEVEKAHNELGVNEEDYDEEERRYDVLEYQWTKNEGDILGDLIEDIEELDIIPPREDKAEPDPKPATTPDFLYTQDAFPDSNSGTNTTTEETQQDFTDCSSNDSQYGIAEIAMGDQAGNYTDPDMEEIPPEHRSQLLDSMRQVDITKEAGLPEGRRASEPVRPQSDFLRPPVTARRPRSEADLAAVEPRWQSIRSHVSHWILDSLKGSLFQKALAKAQLPGEDLDEKAWWGLLKSVWSTDAANEGPEAEEMEDEGEEGEEAAEDEEDDYFESDDREYAFQRGIPGGEWS
ncbi:hypothetical protein DBV05_g10838 [Lasiodiplodia theobromae]|uniref:Uncharacterized protein n=1 Tax=Lasiodiplodia theobromae TaxID=45133 RepID=A0A5N5CYT5_9PEZI|nr:hypothetical protein DBV05_g10838 [Lasiodiplodia theobromae]